MSILGARGVIPNSYSLNYCTENSNVVKVAWAAVRGGMGYLPPSKYPYDLRETR